MNEKKWELIKEIISYKTDAETKESIGTLPFFEVRLMNKIKERTSARFSYEDFIVTARQALYTGSCLLILSAGLFLFNNYSATTANTNLTTEDYLLQNTASSLEKKVFVESNISEDDIISLAMNTGGSEND
ncbi:MAG: hypothetical protein A3J83_00850 [Elusimicrobia bacterium RIFOXYA2_FULL_40_6]|nr:MAG: hypothetical protein A3J83_00850 [Elusimicrobia bacterium RIFOXYA2_FULL_40_6]